MILIVAILSPSVKRLVILKSETPIPKTEIPRQWIHRWKNKRWRLLVSVGLAIGNGRSAAKSCSAKRGLWRTTTNNHRTFGIILGPQMVLTQRPKIAFEPTQIKFGICLLHDIGESAEIHTTGNRSKESWLWTELRSVDPASVTKY